ncbi:hypothetical protein PAHAL_1G447500 [Panicum hallii]|uniref:Uncharacterized protein n=1 Tax=Panicum hallii TaxID=206008 RepID=A0A2T8KYF6_9POAL|nr:hypothetical protein PAHAL_1G447500 [Panicum hallii]PVH67193.1 hypothetical protein PAHAL_1G447500 [Panicum hallii]PVH67194.1 hypothetical protein PAHAL_1G447500 [Panicum hallii]
MRRSVSSSSSTSQNGGEEGSRRSEAELAAAASRAKHNLRLLRLRRLLVAVVTFARRCSSRSLEPRSGSEEMLHRAMASLQIGTVAEDG